MRRVPDLPHHRTVVVHGPDTEHHRQPQVVGRRAARQPSLGQSAQQEEEQDRVEGSPESREQHVVEAQLPDRDEGEHQHRRKRRERHVAKRAARDDVARRNGLGRPSQGIEAIDGAAPTAVGPLDRPLVAQDQHVHLRPVVLVGRRPREAEPTVQPPLGQVDVMVVRRVLAQSGARRAQVRAGEHQVQDHGAAPRGEKAIEAPRNRGRPNCRRRWRCRRCRCRGRGQRWRRDVLAPGLAVHRRAHGGPFRS